MTEETNIKKTFTIDIGEDGTGMCYAIVKSVQEKKGRSVSGYNMRMLMLGVSKLVRRRYNHLQRFPLPDPSPIITLEQDRTYNPRLITPPNGAH